MSYKHDFCIFSELVNNFYLNDRYLIFIFLYNNLDIKNIRLTINLYKNCIDH